MKFKVNPNDLSKVLFYLKNNLFIFEYNYSSFPTGGAHGQINRQKQYKQRQQAHGELCEVR